MSIVRKLDHADEAVGSSFWRFVEEAAIIEEVHAIAMAAGRLAGATKNGNL